MPFIPLALGLNFDSWNNSSYSIEARSISLDANVENLVEGNAKTISLGLQTIPSFMIIAKAAEYLNQAAAFIKQAKASAEAVDSKVNGGKDGFKNSCPAVFNTAQKLWRKEINKSFTPAHETIFSLLKLGHFKDWLLQFSKVVCLASFPMSGNIWILGAMFWFQMALSVSRGVQEAFNSFPIPPETNPGEDDETNHVPDPLPSFLVGIVPHRLRPVMGLQQVHKILKKAERKSTQ